MHARIMENAGGLVTEVFHHLSFVRPQVLLSKATLWPTFIAGTDNVPSCEWYIDRLDRMAIIRPSLTDASTREFPSTWI